MKRIILFFVLIQLIICNSAQAWITENWDDKRLAAESEIVIIATLNAPSSKTGKLITLDDFISPEVKIEETITPLNVKAVLKGQETSVLIQLRHGSLTEDLKNQFIEDHLFLVVFDPKYKGRYLLFLKKGPDGLYEPVTGQTDPTISILMIDYYEASQ